MPCIRRRKVERQQHVERERARATPQPTCVRVSVAPDSSVGLAANFLGCNNALCYPGHVHKYPSSHQAPAQRRFSPVCCICCHSSRTTSELESPNKQSSCRCFGLHSLAHVTVQHQCFLSCTNLEARSAKVDEAPGPCSNLPTHSWNIHTDLPASSARQRRRVPSAECVGRGCSWHLPIAFLGLSTKATGHSLVCLTGMGGDQIHRTAARHRHTAYGSWWFVLYTWR